MPGAPHDAKGVKLAPKEISCFSPCGAAELRGADGPHGLEMEEVLRRLYASRCWGWWTSPRPSPRSSPAPPSRTELPAAPAEPPPAPEPTGASFLDEDEGVKNALVQAFLEHRTKDPFDLLGVPEEVQVPAMRKAFLAAAERFPPARFRTGDLREKAEALLAAYARAYGGLVEPELLALHRKRRQIAAEKKKSAPRRRRINQDPDGPARRRDAVRLRQAAAGVQQPQGRAGVLPVRVRHRAAGPLPRAPGWARYPVNPKSYARLALQELNEAMKSDPNCEEAPYFAGEIERGEGQYEPPKPRSVWHSKPTPSSASTRTWRMT